MVCLKYILAMLSAVAASLAIILAKSDAEFVHLDTCDHTFKERATTSSAISVTSSDAPDSGCTNGPFTRHCWGNGYSIATNYDADWPQTGRTVIYSLDIQNITLAPDGTPRTVFAVNGQYPGPTIRASWGDILQITVTNSLTTNGTSIHWHGVRQWRSNPMDGTGGITECPIAPGQSRTYTFLCTQFGTSWYHSHYSNQYSDGVVGTIVIDGPTTANYDLDLGTYPITDWFHTPTTEILPLLQSGSLRAPPPGDNILINGTQKALTGSGGAYATTVLTKGKKYKLRLINTSLQDFYQVGLDGHLLCVVAVDFVPINPYTAQWVTLAIGQRADVIITANQNVDSYWFHAVPQSGCSENRNSNGLGIFTYTGASSLVPSNSSATNAPSAARCTDSNTLEPYVKLNVPSNYTVPNSSILDVGFAITQNVANETLVQWNLNFTAIDVKWSFPTLEYVMHSNTNYPKNANIITLPNANRWSYWVIQSVPTVAPPQPHPMHLHGHDFYVLGAGSGMYSDSNTLKYNNPPRRDVAVLPAGGWLVLAFITDNPGAWLLHCHIAWHISLGLGAQFLETPSSIPGLVGTDLGTGCRSWAKYYSHAPFKQNDSGL